MEKIFDIMEDSGLTSIIKQIYSASPGSKECGWHIINELEKISFGMEGTIADTRSRAALAIASVEVRIDRPDPTFKPFTTDVKNTEELKLWLAGWGSVHFGIWWLHPLCSHSP